MSGQAYAEQPQLHASAPYRAALLTYPGNMRKALEDVAADPSKTLLGVAHGIPSVFVTKILASTKPDFIWIDAEHGIFGRETLFDAIQAAQHHSEGRALVVVRVPKYDETTLVTALDAGASAIVIPHVESAEEVTSFMKTIYYGPRGQRSFSPWTFTPGISDASLYADDAFNVKTSNNHICVIPQVESVKGIENVEEIVAVPGISALMFGPGDFSIDAQIPLKLGGEPHPVFAQAFGKLINAAKSHKMPLFGAAQTPDMLPMLLQQGYAAVAVAFDYWGLAGLVAGALKTGRDIVKEASGAAAP